MHVVGRLRLLAAATALVATGVTGGASGATFAGAPPDTPPRQALIDVPEGCPIQQTADVVFVGTVLDSDYRTVRFRIDQLRAGDLGRFASDVDGRFLVDVRYGVDSKFLQIGGQYLIGASELSAGSGLLSSKVAEPLESIGGDEVIAVDETDQSCPAVEDPNVTLHTDGTRVDAGILAPLSNNRLQVVGAVLAAVGAVLGAVLAIALFRFVVVTIGERSRRRQEERARRPAARRRPPGPARRAGAAR